MILYDGSQGVALEYQRVEILIRVQRMTDNFRLTRQTCLIFMIISINPLGSNFSKRTFDFWGSGPHNFSVMNLETSGQTPGCLLKIKSSHYLQKRWSNFKIKEIKEITVKTSLIICLIRYLIG